MKFLVCVILLATIQGLAVNAAPASSRVDSNTSYNAVGAEEGLMLDEGLGQENTHVHA
jgi:hypothetical protein